MWTVGLLGGRKSDSDFIMFIFRVTRGLASFPTLLFLLDTFKNFHPLYEVQTGCSEL